MCDLQQWWADALQLGPLAIKGVSFHHILLQGITVLCNLEKVDIFDVTLNFCSLMGTERMVNLCVFCLPQLGPMQGHLDSCSCYLKGTSSPKPGSCPVESAAVGTVLTFTQCLTTVGLYSCLLMKRVRCY